MKHKHYDMIVAKAANVELAVFCKNRGEWKDCGDNGLISWSFDLEYFPCLPQHKEACLHWLNGGEVQILNSPRHDWMLIDSYEREPDWYADSDFMSDECRIRIKPRKEKRWIGYCANRNQTIPHPQKSKELAADYTARHYNYPTTEWQFIEIDVEV